MNEQNDSLAQDATCRDCGMDSPCDEKCPNYQDQEIPANDRDLRTGAHVLQMAKSLGWPDDGEGALEFMLRRAREVAFEDAEIVRLSGELSQARAQVERANACAAEWRAMAKRHDDAASTADEVGMDDDELCIHIESSRIYNLCAEAISPQHSSTVSRPEEDGQ